MSWDTVRHAVHCCPRDTLTAVAYRGLEAIRSEALAQHPDPPDVE